MTYIFSVFHSFREKPLTEDMIRDYTMQKEPRSSLIFLINLNKNVSTMNIGLKKKVESTF